MCICDFTPDFQFNLKWECIIFCFQRVQNMVIGKFCMIYIWSWLIYITVFYLRSLCFKCIATGYLGPHGLLRSWNQVSVSTFKSCTVCIHWVTGVFSVCNKALWALIVIIILHFLSYFMLVCYVWKLQQSCIGFENYCIASLMKGVVSLKKEQCSKIICII